ncbi:unnamed protein product [Rotaria sordida]|uniref:Kynurenine 3-monooxygenase n=1 Tax=Rotaria sordida TaxID=392033 RepID=A0A818T223_9BILA|nr:unnamed protein product [Rotaria sordida]CAF3671413.1 unnamed protein product [Rotaria sordida]
MTHTSGNSSTPIVAIVGAGLGGTLCACFFAKHGFNVHLFELRSDIRTQKVVKGRSINMALSHRGRNALAYIDCENIIVRNGIAMRARMLHDVKCRTKAVPYGSRPEHENISIDRRILNELLLDEANKSSKIKIYFQHKFISWNQEEKTATFRNKSGEYIDFKADALIGYDGSYSAVRTAMMKIDSIDFSQEYIESHYMEFCIPSKDGEFAMETNYLHIWPRHEFMLIALPNQDKTFTTTLFLPLSIFKKITTIDELLTFFQQYFPDAISFIGRENLIETYFSSKPLPLISIKCSSHVSTNGDILIMGDAAHSMVPFYGQGMNSAFEDTLVLFEKLKENNFQLSKSFYEYNKTRIPDAHAIVALSMYNYNEMRHLVTLPSYFWRKQIDHLLYRLIPNWWIPLYTMVAFTTIPYQRCVQLRQRQDQILKIIRIIGFSITGIYLIKRYAFTIIKPIATKFIVQKILPKFAADQIV